MKEQTLGIIGCGQMGRALLKGFLDSKILDKKQVFVFDSAVQCLQMAVEENKGIQTAHSDEDLARKVNLILLAVKPQDVSGVCREIRPAMDLERHSVISICAGIRTATLEALLGSVPVIRVMPNQPALVGQGAAAVTRGKYAIDTSLEQEVGKLFETVGKVVYLPEELLNVVTAVSGSGPAYFYYMMERLIQFAVANGLSEEVARKLVVQTALGSAHMAQSGKSLDQLRAAVTSKGGTTEAAIKIFEEKKLGEIFEAGLSAAIRRARELDQEGR